MTWSEWSEKNFELLVYWAKRRDFLNWSDLVQSLIIHLEKNWHHFEKVSEEKKIAWCQTWFKNQVKWLNSSHNIDIWGHDRKNGHHLEFKTELYDLGECNDFEDFIDLGQEKLWWSDEFSDLQISRLKKIEEIYSTFEPEEQILFDLYFKVGLSQRAIAKKINIPLSAVYNMLKALKTKIKNEFI